jgi:hypothetical protein
MKSRAVQGQEQPASRLIPLTQWNEHHPWPPVGGLRHLVFNASDNGFDAVVRRCGRRVLIDEAAFLPGSTASRRPA